MKSDTGSTLEDRGAAAQGAVQFDCPVPRVNLVIHRLPDEPIGDLSEVHLWLLDLDKDFVLSEASALSAAELEHCRRLKEPLLRHRFAARCGLVRRVLAGMLRIAPHELEFVADPIGKPKLVGVPIDFNLSHSENLMWLAATCAGEVGVDVEVFPPDQDVMPLAEGRCTPEEIRTLQGLPAIDRAAAFYRLWTMREARAKASGREIAAMSDGECADGQEHRVLEWEVCGKLTGGTALLCGAVALQLMAGTLSLEAPGDQGTDSLGHSVGG